MAYTINKYSGEQLIVLEDGTIDTSTSINLVGRNYVGYGEAQNENYVWMLENFANANPPSRPLKGQLWFNSTNNLVHAYDGTAWAIVGSAVLGDLPPNSPAVGSFWLRTPVNILNVWTGSGWSFIGPEAVPGFGTTRCRADSLIDSAGDPRPVIYLETDENIIGIITATAFTINPSNSVSGFENNLVAGINLSSSGRLKGNVVGNATSADRFSTARTINGTPFDGTQNVNITAPTTNPHVRGAYLTGNNFDGSNSVTWDVDATSSNVIGKVVARNSQGGFSAGTITATFAGDLTGNVTSSGTSTFNIIEANTFIGATLTGNAYTATQLATPRTINGVRFDGSANITITAAADTLTGTVLNSTVVNSSLTSLGTLVNLNVADTGANIGSSGQLKFFIEGVTPTIRSSVDRLNFDCADPTRANNETNISLVSSSLSLSLGGDNAPAFIPDNENDTNLGHPVAKWNKIYANTLIGNANTATLATTATNIAGGGAGSIPYQTAAGTTAMLGLGTAGYVLKAQASGIVWDAISSEQLTKGSYVNMINTSTTGGVGSFNSSVPVTISVDATSTNTASKVVARDASGNFAAGTITANLTGDVSGNSTTATRLQTARTINGVAFDGTANITITATDTNRVAKSGDSMTGYLTLNGNPTSALHAVPKQYVDAFLQRFTFTYGNTVYSTSGYTNQVGSWNNGANFFDVFPPSGKTMSNLVAFIPSIAVIHYAGGVNGDDSMRCTWSNLGDRIRVYVQNTEQRSTPAANYLAIWS